MDLRAVVASLRAVYGDDALPKPFDRLAEVLDRRDGVVDGPVAGSKQRREAIAQLLAAEDALGTALEFDLSQVPAEKAAKAKLMLGQLLLGVLAEKAFEKIYEETLQTTELRLEDFRNERNDTDYRVLNGGGRPVFRINIKFHGTLFRRAKEMVGLEPEDCFALATYKIWSGTMKQEDESLPYVFLVISSPISAADVAARIPSDIVDLAVLAHVSKKVEGKRSLEERLVDHLLSEGAAAFATTAEELRTQLASAPWRVLSARRADRLLREKLFDRVFAVRTRNFTRSFRNAELDMHFSLSQDMMPLTDFLALVREQGLHGVSVRLERGTI